MALIKSYPKLFLWLPLLFIAVICAPLIGYLLPATESYFTETYQPLRTLKFLSTKGADYHKYGPLPNLLLAPTYLISLAYWYITGSFSNPSADFPYGFHQPFKQITILIAQGRVLFLILTIITLAFTLKGFTCITRRTHLIALAFMLLVATNINNILYFVNTRPDGPMLLFASLSLMLYCKIIFDKLTIKRAVWMSIWASAAISCKELAGPLFVLPYLGLGIEQFIRSKNKPDARSLYYRAIAYTLVAGIGTYLLLNVIYAPTAWLARMSHWVGGEGTSSAVWGGGLATGSLSYTSYLSQILIACLNNLGPGAVIVLCFSLLLFPFNLPKHWYMLLLPPLSIFFLGLLPLGYVVDRFYIIFMLAWLPFLIAQLDAIAIRLRILPIKYILTALASLLLLLNIYWATFALIRPYGLPQAMIETDLLRHASITHMQTLNILSLHPQTPGKNRLTYLGYNLDPQSLTQIIQSPQYARPDIIYASHGEYHFILDAQKYPQRAAVLQKETGLDVNQFQSIESLGYKLRKEITPPLPTWFWLNNMPVVRTWQTRNTMLVYERINDQF